MAARDKHSSLFVAKVSDEEKRFYEIDTSYWFKIKASVSLRELILPRSLQN
jgi:hypothetical protein